MFVQQLDHFGQTGGLGLPEHLGTTTLDETLTLGLSTLPTLCRTFVATLPAHAHAWSRGFKQFAAGLLQPGLRPLAVGNVGADDDELRGFAVGAEKRNNGPCPPQ